MQVYVNGSDLIIEGELFSSLNHSLDFEANRIDTRGKTYDVTTEPNEGYEVLQRGRNPFLWFHESKAENVFTTPMLYFCGEGVRLAFGTTDVPQKIYFKQIK